jgi:hypothetical protein
VTGAGRDLMASRPVGSPPAGPDGSVPAALVIADGKVVVTTVGAKVIELSARTGQLLRVLYTSTGGGSNGTAGPAGCEVLSLAPSGIHVLVSCLAFGRVDGGRFTPLPGFPSASSSGISAQQAAAW